MKSLYSLSIIASALALLAFSVPVYAEKHDAKMDSRIEESAKQSYVFKTYLKDDDIKVKSKHGEVTLTGSVTETFHKSLAQETVADLPGVKSVDNKLETKKVPPTVNSDEWLRDKVKVTLTFHRSVSALTTEVSVKDGVVTLRGDAASQAQKDLTAEYAKDVEGVKDVNNQMNVSEPSKHKRTVGQKIDDSSITAQVKMTLLSHRSTSALYTTVKTIKGVVKLEGKAKSQFEKDLATKLANDVHGVKSVNNQMSVE
jgi:osmotically-inducible protein OsmY